VALQWHTQVKYFTDLPISYFVGTLAIEKKSFTKISPADQAIVRDVMSKIFHEIDEQNRKDNVSAYNALLKQGIKPVKPTSAEVADWEKNGELASVQMVKDGIVSQSAATQLNSLLIAARAGKK
jgi:TRAP-type transport system periplasmic protein